MLSVVESYTAALDILDDYDHQKINKPDGRKAEYVLSYDECRRFIDMIISQADMPYMEALMRYNQALEQRNRMLRDGFSDPMLYESVEMIMDGAAALIRRRRSENTALITEIFTKYYSEIAGDGETAAMQYMISGDKYGPLALAFAQTRERDTILKYTSVGPHRDDIAFTLDSMPVRQTASQGQSKTFTIAWLSLSFCGALQAAHRCCCSMTFSTNSTPPAWSAS